MTDQELLKMYIPMVDFIADICGPSCEVLLHDISNPEQSVIAVRNNHSGRSIGSPMTDLAHRIIQDGSYREKDYLANYHGFGNGKDFLSSTYYIKNEGRLVGMLCVNNDVSGVSTFRADVETFLRRFPGADGEPGEVFENLESPVVSTGKSMIEAAVQEMGIPPKRMSMEEKTRLVRKLNEQGILRMKGAVSEIAARLGISEATVYRYLNKK